MEFEHGRYIGTIQLRETHKGLPLKPKVKDVLDGKTMEFTYCWTCEPDEKYAGECAMEPSVCNKDDSDRELFREADILWIASGDVKWAGE
jgi:hypothetical protein